MNPILKYPGAKWRIADWIIGFMPKHDSYLEPYFGSGAVLFNKAPARIETVNDLDGSIVQFFKTCRERPDELAEALSLTPWAREEFMACDFIDDDAFEDDVERARQFAVRCWMAYGTSTKVKTGWRNSKGNGGSNPPGLWRRLPSVVCEVADRLRDVHIENRPAVDVVRNHNFHHTLIYADPPYIEGTRSFHGDHYRHEMTDADHAELLEALIAHKGMVILSGYDHPMYRDTLNDWHIETRAVAAERGTKRTELLWMNRAVWEQQMGIQRLDEMI